MSPGALGFLIIGVPLLMFVFLFKLAIAAIPAVILLTMVIMFVGGALMMNLGMPIRPF